MRHRSLVSLLLLGVCVLPLILPPVAEAVHTAQNLTLTAGGGSWKTSCYNFSRSYATKTGFQPLDGVNRFSIVAWVKPAIIVGDHAIFSQLKAGPDFNSRVEVYFTDNDVNYRLGTGAACPTLTINDVLTANNYYMIVMAWDKDLNSGKFDGYVFNFNASTWTNGTSATGNTGASAADGDLYVGARTGGTLMLFQGRIHSVSIFNVKLSTSQLASLKVGGSDTVISDTIAQNYYTLNEGSGTTFNDWAKAWRDSETWTLALDTLYIVWHSVENWTLTLDVLHPSWVLAETWTILLDVLTPLWLRAEQWVVSVLVHSWFPSPVQDPYFFIFIGGAIGSMVCLTLTLLRVKARDPSGAGAMLVLTIVLLGVMVGVLLA